MRIFLILISLCLSGCDSVKRSIGYTYESPDEFTILPQQSLKIPENYNLPAPSNDRYLSWQKTAPNTRAILTDTDQTPSFGKVNAQGENILLQKLETPDPDIRTTVNTEASIASADKPLIVFGPPTVKGKALDAALELKKFKESHGSV